jgi:hypothetical protein
MRHIDKQRETLPCLEDWANAQVAGRAEHDGNWEPLPLSYPSFGRTKELKRELLAEQFGLCAYTGAGIDVEGLKRRRPREQDPPRIDYWFTAHIEHLKPQSACRCELEQAGGIYGRDRGEDTHYRNMVAAMLVSGSPEQQFGAAIRGDKELAVIPTSQDCERAFFFFEDGDVIGANENGSSAISTLLLDHKTLRDWRTEAIDFHLPLREQTPSDELRRLIVEMEIPLDGRLPDFSFVIASLARQYLGMQEDGAVAKI